MPVWTIQKHTVERESRQQRKRWENPPWIQDPEEAWSKGHFMVYRFELSLEFFKLKWGLKFCPLWSTHQWRKERKRFNYQGF